MSRLIETEASSLADATDSLSLLEMHQAKPSTSNGTRRAMSSSRPFKAGVNTMKKNIVSAIILASVSCLSVACVNTAPNGDMTSEQLTSEKPSDSPDGKTNTPGAQNKPLFPGDKLVVPPSDMPFDASYEDWAAAYWQWAMSIPVQHNPVLDGPCEQDQSGDVFFLASTQGGGHQRSCTIPRGKGIFIPLLTTVARSCPEMADNQLQCQDLVSEDGIRGQAGETIDTANPRLRLAVDGQVISTFSQYRVESSLFLDTSPKDPQDRLFSKCSGPIESNVCQVPEGTQRRAVADGYFVMLRQLSDGPHTIEIAANVSPESSEPAFEVTYHIFISSTGSADSL
jgi:hypothetical protein